MYEGDKLGSVPFQSQFSFCSIFHFVLRSARVICRPAHTALSQWIRPPGARSIITWARSATALSPVRALAVGLRGEEGHLPLELQAIPLELQLLFPRPEQILPHLLQLQGKWDE